jgi:RimJ/RimL family protein N-acetyltransferase
MTNPHLHVLTDRLDLRKTDPVGDLDDLFAIFSDPDGWRYDPEGRHTDRARTQDWLTRAAARFDEDGLSYWTVRRRDTGEIIGVGGAQRQRTRAWNLNYRLGTAHHGQGFATELGVAERLGLTNHGSGTDPSDGQQRLAWADRPLD